METKTIPDFGIILPDLFENIVEFDDDSLIKSANSIDQLLESGDFPEKYVYFGIFYAALAYDIANERFEARRLYKSLFESKFPNLNYLVLSETDSKNLSTIFGHIGLREFDVFNKIFSDIIEHLQAKKEFLGETILEEHKDDYLVLFSILSILQKFFKAINKFDTQNIQETLNSGNKIYQDLEKFNPEPWIELIATMYLELIRRISERSIVSLKITPKMKKALYNKRIEELWIPQKQVIGLGLLENESILYSSPPGTGKSFLACLTTGKLNENIENNQTVYLVPSKSLTTQVFDELNTILGTDYKIALSDRDRTLDDDNLKEKDVVVATYEKMDALLRRKKISLGNIQTVIIDEIQNLGEENRGMTLELMITKFMKSQNPIQIIGLSGLLNKQNSEQLAQWMGARDYRNVWRGIKTDETIFFDGQLFHRNGEVEKTLIPLKSFPSVYDKRKFITSYFSKQAIAKNESILISVTTPDLATRLSNDLKDWVHTINLFDTDVLVNLEKNQKKYDEVINQIKSIEPELPEFAKQLISMIKYGIVYHHAGLPMKHKKIIETAIKKNSVNIVVATPTLDAGLNLPIATVLFFNPKYYNGSRMVPIENKRYRNVAGRAGRPGLQRKANVVVIANTQNEFEKFKDKFWKSDLEPIRSSFYQIIKDNKIAISDLDSHLLSFIEENEPTDFESIRNNLTQTWFWKQSQSEKNDRIVLTAIEEGIKTLLNYNFITEIQEKKYHTTEIGKLVNDSMIVPKYAFYLINCIEYLFTKDHDDEEEINMILILCGISSELYSNKKLLSKVTIPNPIFVLKEKIQKIEGIFFDPQDLDLILKFGSILYYWINSFSMKQIVELCGLESQSNSGRIDENLIKDAYRTLQGIFSIAESIGNNDNINSFQNSNKVLKLIKKVTEYCKDGTRENFVKSLLDSGVSHIGRNTALKLNEYLKSQQKNLLSLSENEFKKIFFDNQETAKILFEEIHQMEDYFIIQNNNQ